MSGALTSLKPYPSSAGSSWTPITLASRYYIKGLALTLEGACTAGTRTIKVDPGSGFYPETANCDLGGKFVWSKTFLPADEGDLTLTVSGFDVGDTAVAGASASLDIRIDNTPPAPPVITTPAVTPYTYNGASPNLTIQGTISADTNRLSGPAGITISPVGTNWSYNALLVAGSTSLITFYAYDLAGNQSAGTTQSISWSPSIQLMFAGSYSIVGQRVDGVSGFTIEATGDVNPDSAVHAGSGFSILTGFNKVINQVRAD